MINRSSTDTNNKRTHYQRSYNVDLLKSFSKRKQLLYYSLCPLDIYYLVGL